MLYLLEPEVAGELGENTIIENFNNVRNKLERPEVTHLHYLFLGWLGDEILECTPCFIVTKRLAEAIKGNSLNGFEFRKIELSKSDEFEEVYPQKDLPNFVQLIPKGSIELTDDKYNNWSGHDLSISQNAYLVVTKKALGVLQKFSMNNCIIKEIAANEKAKEA